MAGSRALLPHEEYDRAQELLERREEEHGDAAEVVIAALLSGRTTMVARSYVMEKLATVNGPLPATLLDIFRMRTLARALSEHPESPIRWIADVSGNKWWV